MQRMLGILTMALLLAPVPAHAGDLILRDVIELHRTGLGDDLLIAVIDADGGPFALGFADIQDLKSDGLSERVIAALIRTGAPPAVFVEPAAQVPSISQQVLVYAPAVVVVERSERRPRHAPDGAAAPPLAAGRPPATWVTRREDGRNVAPEPRKATSTRR